MRIWIEILTTAAGKVWVVKLCAHECDTCCFASVWLHPITKIANRVKRKALSTVVSQQEGPVFRSSSWLGPSLHVLLWCSNHHNELRAVSKDSLCVRVKLKPFWLKRQLHKLNFPNLFEWKLQSNFHAQLITFKCKVVLHSVYLLQLSLLGQYCSTGFAVKNCMWLNALLFFFFWMPGLSPNKIPLIANYTNLKLWCGSNLLRVEEV